MVPFILIFFFLQKQAGELSLLESRTWRALFDRDSYVGLRRWVLRAIFWVDRPRTPLSSLL